MKPIVFGGGQRSFWVNGMCQIVKPCKLLCQDGNTQVCYADVFTLSKRTKGASYQLIIIGQ